MNERILELWENSDKIHTRYPERGSPIYASPELLEKFAELIVLECGAVAYKAYWANPETVRGRHIEEKIREHFGVK